VPALTATTAKPASSKTWLRFMVCSDANLPTTG
jgi:hypothetical protein